VRGVQIAGGASIDRGAVRGVQIAGGANVVAGDVSGVQVASTNLARNVRGVQIGAVNVADRVRGLQIGVVNIAREASAGIGLVNIYTDGFLDEEVFVSADQLLLAGVRHGSGAFYSIYAAGAHRGEEETALAVAFGLGLRSALASLETSVDVLGVRVFDGDHRWAGENSLVKLRPLIALPVSDSLALFGGPTLTLHFDDGDREGYAPFEAMTLHEGSEIRLRAWAGATAGVRF
jgi:hypothetical protein